LSGGWQISAGDVSEALRPALYALSVLASAWVFASARCRGRFRPSAVWAWAAATFFLPAVTLPLYLVARMYARPAAPGDSKTETVESASDEEEARPEDAESPGGTDEPRAAEPLRRRLLPTLLYAAVLLLAGGIYFYQDYRSFDAHLARGARAKLNGRRAQTIKEYRAALGVRDDAHTRKLLGLELLEDGRAEEAVAELRAAEAGGEPDGRLPFRLAAALDALGRRAEAAEAYERFGRGPLCAQDRPDDLCAAATARLLTLGKSPD
jgi:tetratricopeptide (TPR) repeat protein